MASFKEIKERITSIRATRKITSAMTMISSSKLTKSQAALADVQPYMTAVERIMRRAMAAGEVDTEFTKRRRMKRVAVVAFSSDGSLVGGFNSNVTRELRAAVDRYIGQKVERIDIYSIGRKVHDAVVKWRCPEIEDSAYLPSKIDYGTAAELAMQLAERFVKKDLDSVLLIYHHLRSPGSQVVTHDILLPITLAPQKEETKMHDHIFEPSHPEILLTVVHRYLKFRLYTALLDSTASEHAARMIAMQSATDNADKLVEELTVYYNKSRQQAITNELMDIVGGKAHDHV
ncbi:MAG: ATP synthase F1 subunit gamma [Rikenellaceae bacterium]|nr:ATP synthase F1 subunit gamma [Rikenellaceae bacterium]MCL2693231.1 ATP synthase F1 subunit gamma [Rikenellaceae bacterium]